jgi:hypothetical protein
MPAAFYDPNDWTIEAFSYDMDTVFILDYSLLNGSDVLGGEYGSWVSIKNKVTSIEVSNGFELDYGCIPKLGTNFAYLSIQSKEYSAFTMPFLNSGTRIRLAYKGQGLFHGFVDDIMTTVDPESGIVITSLSCVDMNTKTSRSYDSPDGDGGYYLYGITQFMNLQAFVYNNRLPKDIAGTPAIPRSTVGTPEANYGTGALDTDFLTLGEILDTVCLQEIGTILSTYGDTNSPGLTAYARGTFKDAQSKWVDIDLDESEYSNIEFLPNNIESINTVVGTLPDGTIYKSISEAGVTRYGQLNVEIDTKVTNLAQLTNIVTQIANYKEPVKKIASITIPANIGTTLFDTLMTKCLPTKVAKVTYKTFTEYYFINRVTYTADANTMYFTLEFWKGF